MCDTKPAASVATKPLDFTKPLQTRGGFPVTIITAAGRDRNYPILGYIDDNAFLSCWTAEGIGTDAVRNLVNVPEKRTVYLNVYSNGSVSNLPFPSRAVADKNASGSRIACIKVEFTEGQFDD